MLSSSARRSSREALLASGLGSRNFRDQLNQIRAQLRQLHGNGPLRLSGTFHFLRYPRFGPIFKRIAQLPRHKFEHTWSKIPPLLWELDP